MHRNSVFVYVDDENNQSHQASNHDVLLPGDMTAIHSIIIIIRMRY